jgi:SAM-dependent methyltransferase
MSAVAAFGATAPSAARVCARFGRGGGAASTWRRARALPRTVARSAAADVEAMASASDAETGAADDDDLRFVYVGNFDFFTLEETVEAAVRDLLGEALRDRVRSMAVPGWRDKRLEDGTLKPRKKRDEGKRNRGFAVVEFDTPKNGRAAAEALNGVVFESRLLRSSAGVRADVRGAPRRRAEPKSETAAEAGEVSEAERLRRERRAHNRRQKRRKKARDDALLEEALQGLLQSHPLWEPCAESQTIDEPEDAERAEEPLEEPLEDASSDRFAENASRVSSTNLETREWWDDARWRGGWGALYSRWRDLDFAKALGAVDWENCAPSVDPAGSNTKGGTERGRRKRLQVESFRAILVAARAVVGRRPETTNASPPVVVDFGCGTGNLLLPLAAAEPSMRFVGVDVNRRSVELLAERAARAGLTNVDAVCGLAETYDGTCDVALALHVCGAGTDAVLLQAQARGAAFVVAPCCVGKLKDGGLKSISAMKKDVLDQTGTPSASGGGEDDGIFAGGGEEVLVRPGKSHAPITVIHPRSSWMRGRIQRPAYLGLAAAADWSGHQGVDPLSNSEQSKALGRFPRDAKAAVELDRGAAAAEAGYGVRVMKMAHEGAGLKNDLIVGFPKGADPLREFVEGPEACFR